MKLTLVLIAALAILVSASCATPAPANNSIAPPVAPSEQESTQPPISPANPSQSLTELSVHFINVGQGDSILIDSGQTEILIDGGEASPGIVPYLETYVQGPLEVMVATHPHADHIGGLIAVLAFFNVRDIWLNGDTSTSTTYNNFMSAVNAEGAIIHTARRGDSIKAGDLNLDVLNPTNMSLGSTNNNSIVSLLNYGDIGFLFMGDAEKEAETSMVTAGLVPHVEVLKVGHHGSRTASSSQFLQACHPEVGIYMAGVDNSFGHPHQETIAALKNIGAKIYGTDVYGNIYVITDGITYKVQCGSPALTPPYLLLPLSPQPPIIKPYPATQTPCPGATAICNDGTCSYSAHRSGTCSHHGGVRQWVNRPPN